MPDNLQQMERDLKTLARAERLFQQGDSAEEVYSKVKLGKQAIEALCNRYSHVPNVGEILSNNPTGYAIVPVFKEPTDQYIEQIGSGVLLRLGAEVFLLTAAHVMDESEAGVLMISTQDGIEPLNGHWARGKMPESGRRKDDRVDLAYVRLAPDLRQRLPDDVQPIGVDDLDLVGSATTGDFYTFAGYPWRKTKREGNKIAGAYTTYTGHNLPPDVYKSMGYSLIGNVLIRLRRKKTNSTRHGPGSPAVRPEGISGGGVFKWPTTFKERHEVRRLKITAIAHTYHDRKHAMGATRVIASVMSIVDQNPDLAKHFVDVTDACEEFSEFVDEKLGRQTSVPTPDLTGITWYTAETYHKCMAAFDDRDGFPDSYEAWRKNAEDSELMMAASGQTTVRVEMKLEEFLPWCKKQGYSRIDHIARMHYGSFRAMGILSTGK